ncbi:hypothetical protein PSTG_06034 [Puccinia striiformis f. sp. tritici PST-78]|uniref:Uncharacterized protein n=1 Tax=Puccinia striiformis f. sp. tritici PST-78 TaxID=1165861 RepID=A0A0L0VMW7_9BASI|nr:hypothetical protein PSTG_06034 [Puccinia striiformis f. sp. tritici PST-78]
MDSDHSGVITRLNRSKIAGQLCNRTVLFVLSNQSLGVYGTYPGTGALLEG